MQLKLQSGPRLVEFNKMKSEFTVMWDNFNDKVCKLYNNMMFLCLRALGAMYCSSCKPPPVKIGTPTEILVPYKPS